MQLQTHLPAPSEAGATHLLQRARSPASCVLSARADTYRFQPVNAPTLSLAVTAAMKKTLRLRMMNARRKTVREMVQNAALRGPANLLRQASYGGNRSSQRAAKITLRGTRPTLLPRKFGSAHAGTGTACLPIESRKDRCMSTGKRS